MKTLKYLIFFLFASVWATREEQAQAMIGELADQQRQIAEELSNLKYEDVMDYIGRDWRKMYFWFATNSAGEASFDRWSRDNPQDYWRLIKGFDYLGQESCFWSLFWDPHSSYESLSRLVIGCLPDEQLKILVEKHFLQIKLDIEDDQAAGRELQATQWSIAFEVLLKYKPSIFMWFVEKEPIYSLFWLGPHCLFVFERWLKYTPETLYIWIEAHWQDFKYIITQYETNFDFWNIMLQANPSWIAEHKKTIVDIVSSNPEYFCCGLHVRLFIKRFPNFPFDPVDSDFKFPPEESNEFFSNPLAQLDRYF